MSGDPSPRIGQAAPWRAGKTFIAALGCLCCACVFGWLRWHQTATEIRGSDIEFFETHEISWQAQSHALAQTGIDPYGWLRLPAASIPLHEVTLEFQGLFNEAQGGFYIYPVAEDAADRAVTEASVVRGTVEDGDGRFAVHWRLDRARAIRVDLPDYLTQPLRLDRVILRTSFAGARSWAFLLTLLFGAAAFLLPVWSASREWLRQHPFAEASIFVLLIGAKVWIAGDLRLSQLGPAFHDDAHFVRQADSILSGQWLGPFGQITLAKGPAYSLFLAAVSVSGLPLQSAQTLLHGVACLLLVFALRPLIPSPGVRLTLFTVILFDPHTLSAAAVGRVLRSGVQPALTILALAGLIGTAARIHLQPRRVFGWALLGGLAGAAFWFSREEGIWLLPSAALILLPAAIVVVRNRRDLPVLRAFFVALPLLSVVFATWTLRAVNAHRYGAYISVDTWDGAFPDAYGALLRIDAGSFIPGVPVSRVMRTQAYAASPAFKELEPWLEGQIGHTWSQAGWAANDPEAGKEIRGGWFQWALREAAAAAGHYRDARSANAYWRQVAAEINAACDSGRIAAGPRRSGFFPPWHSSQWRPLLPAVVTACDVVLRAADFRTQPYPSEGSAGQLALFRKITNQQGMGSAPTPGSRTFVRVLIHRVYFVAGFPLTAVALAALLLTLWQAVVQRTRLLPALILLALAGGAAALVIIVALVQVTSFDAVHAIYLAPATPLVLALWVLSPYWAATLFAHRQQASIGLRQGEPAGARVRRVLRRFRPTE